VRVPHPMVAVDFDPVGYWLTRILALGVGGEG
jgi:hypothetical protein